MPKYEDCARIAKKYKVPLKRVYTHALNGKNNSLHKDRQNNKPDTN